MRTFKVQNPMCTMRKMGVKLDVVKLWSEGCEGRNPSKSGQTFNPLYKKKKSRNYTISELFFRLAAK